MKKTILLTVMIAATLIGCSNDDNNAPPTYMKVLTMGTGSSPGNPTTYYINYGTSSDDSVLVYVTEAVYNHYMSEMTDTVHNPRWRGEVTE